MVMELVGVGGSSKIRETRGENEGLSYQKVNA
jgi:hypothetical protein